jgi:hypothetical protein
VSALLVTYFRKNFIWLTFHETNVWAKYSLYFQDLTYFRLEIASEEKLCVGVRNFKSSLKCEVINRSLSETFHRKWSLINVLLCFVNWNTQSAGCHFTRRFHSLLVYFLSYLNIKFHNRITRKPSLTLSKCFPSGVLIQLYLICFSVVNFVAMFVRITKTILKYLCTSLTKPLCGYTY